MERPEVQFSKLKVEPTYRVLSQTIIEQILNGTLKPGDSLPTEAALCEQFGVNRSSVREGIRLLEETGMLRRVNAKRLMVSRPTAGEMASQMERAMRLHQVTFFELWETLMVLEPKTASLAAMHLDAKDIEAIAANLELTRNLLDDPAALAALDVEFHALVARGVHNRALLLTREPIARLFYPAFEAVLSRVPESGTRLLHAHEAIFKALQASDPQEASLWMEKHIRDFKRGFEMASLDLQSSGIETAG
jgi:GntR family transcriptional regulator, transcriptional repressor for pyruvate dehydrogenase complex